MARGIQYGDPGEPDPYELVPPKRKEPVRYDQQPSYKYYGGDPWWDTFANWWTDVYTPMIKQRSEAMDRQWLQEAYKIPPTGSMWYQGPEAQQPSGSGADTTLGYTGDISGGGAEQWMGHGALGQMAPGTVQWQNPYRHRRGIGYQPPGGEGEGGGVAGQGERINYEYIQEVERGLKEQGITGTTVPQYDKEGNLEAVIRRDDQGRILRITRGVSGKTAQLMYAGRGGRSIGGRGPSMKTEMRRHRGQERRVKTTGEKHGGRKPTGQPTGVVSPYPDWVINMSNWRGI